MIENREFFTLLKVNYCRNKFTLVANFKLLAIIHTLNINIFQTSNNILSVLDYYICRM